MSSEIPYEIREFIRKYISSVSLLELLLLLKQNPSRSWTAAELSGEMRTNNSYAAAQLHELASVKLVVPDERTDSFRLTDEPDVVRIIGDLEVLYAHRRSSTISSIYAQPMDSIRDFANAFKIKKD
ncbi:hypothetical protein [uncultured Bdellovibrio sp.]|uniref:hypothetical protein n=1 Tax=Bdellovibrio sp. HCB-162 TaxID=3394234 RepID=UPI0025DC8C7F|nr:hypothetical protein [uncultured Bdellovibrio sp.]